MASCLYTTYQRHSSSDAIEDIARQTVTTHLSISEHVRDVISRCGQSMHALQILPACLPGGDSPLLPCRQVSDRWSVEAGCESRSLLRADSTTPSVTDRLLIMYGILLRQLSTVGHRIFLYGPCKQLFEMVKFYGQKYSGLWGL